MGIGVKRSVMFAVAGLLWLTGCETTSLKVPEFLSWKTESAASNTATETAAATSTTTETTGTTATETTGTVATVTTGPPPPITPYTIGEKGPPTQLLNPATPSRPNDDLSLGRMNFRQGNYGLAEHYFRRAVESGPRDSEAWLGLAASYDRLRRFDLADRAYNQLYAMLGRTPEILNNQGYSMMLRGKYVRARDVLNEARVKDPANPYIANNIALLEQSVRTRKAVR